MPIPDELRVRIMRLASYRCEYCLIEGQPLTVDHAVPQWFWSRAGAAHVRPPAFPVDHPGNLVAACYTCNVERKRDQVAGLDDLRDVAAWLFMPRSQQWHDHFAWNEDATEMLGLTPTGAVTIKLLSLNESPYTERRRRLRQAAAGGGPPWPS